MFALNYEQANPYFQSDMYNNKQGLILHYSAVVMLVKLRFKTFTWPEASFWRGLKMIFIGFNVLPDVYSYCSHFNNSFLEIDVLYRRRSFHRYT